MPIYTTKDGEYDIPDDKTEAFEKQFPDAIVSYSNGNDRYDIPVNKKSRFLSSFPGAKPFYDGEHVIKGKSQTGGVNMKNDPGGVASGVGVDRLDKEGKKEEEKGFWDTALSYANNAVSYVGDLVEKAGAGAASMGGSIYSALDRADEIANPISATMRTMENEINRRSGSGEEKKSWLREQADGNYAYADELREKSDRYSGKDFTELWKEGDYAGVVGDVFLQASESIPQSLIAMFGGGAGLALTGVSAGARKYDQLDEMPETKDMPEYAKAINAITTGTIEACSEKLGDVQIGKWLKGLYSKHGEEMAKEMIKNNLEGLFKQQFKDHGLLLAPIAEGAEEYASQIAENVTDYCTGVTGDWSPMDGAAESFVYGAGGGAQFALAGLPGVIRNKYRKSVRFINSNTHQDGNMYPAMLKDEDNTPVYIVRGNIALNEDGTINMDKSDRRIVVNVNGKPTYKFIKDIAGITAVDNAESMKKTTLEEIQRQEEMKNEPVDQFADITVDDYIESTPGLTDYGKESAYNNEGEVIEKTKSGAKLAISYLNGEISARDMLVNDVYEYNEEVSEARAKEVADELSEYWAGRYPQYITKTKEEIEVAPGDELLLRVGEGDVGAVVQQRTPDDTWIVQFESPVTIGDVTGRVIELSTKQLDELRNQKVQPESEEVVDGEELKLENTTPVYPVTKDGKPDYNLMLEQDPSLFAEAWEKRSDPEKAKITLERQSGNIGKKIEGLTGRLERETDLNKVGDIEDEINVLEGKKKRIDEVIVSRYGEEQSKQVPEKLSEPEYYGWVARESDDVMEVMEAHGQLKETKNPYNNLQEWQRQLLGKKVKADSYYQFGDRNNVTKQMKAKWFSKEGQSLDVLAKELSEFGKEVTEQDVVEFITGNPSNSVSNTSPEVDALGQRFSELASRVAGMKIGRPDSPTGKLFMDLQKAKGASVSDEALRAMEEKLKAYEQMQPPVTTLEEAIPVEGENEGVNVEDLEAYEREVENVNNDNNSLPGGDNSLSLQSTKLENNEVSESIPQGEFGTLSEEDSGIEETLIELRRRGEENARNAQETGRALPGREQKEIEDRIAEQYAKDKGIWIPMQDVFSLGDPAPSGNENDVYLSLKDNSVFKVNNLMNSGSISSLLERIKFHNYYFPQTKYKLVGFSGFGNRDVFPVLKQDYVPNSTFATPEEIDNYMQSLGLKQTGRAEYSNGDVTISDLYPRNVLKDADGDIYVVDAEFKEKTVSDNINDQEIVVNRSPSEAQKEAGNYKKGHVKLNGFDVTIEQPKGSVRSGVDENGKEWSVTMNNTYGYIRGTKGKDGDHIDIFVGSNPESKSVFVVDQVNKDGVFDEHKVMMGFDTAEDAQSAYLSNYEEGWQGLGNITRIELNDFKKWVDSSTRKLKPFSDYKRVREVENNETNSYLSGEENIAGNGREDQTSGGHSKGGRGVPRESGKPGRAEVYQRVSQGAYGGLPEVSGILGEASEVVRGEKEATGDVEPAEGYKGGQTKALKELAEKRGVWVSDHSSLGDFLEKGGENEVYSKNDKFVYKLNNFEYAGDDLVNFFDRIQAHNELFPNAPYKLIGFSNNNNGEFAAVLEQPYIDASREATEEEISSYMREIGFEDDGDGDFHNDKYEVFDAVPNNVLVGTDGKLYFIDTQIAHVRSDADGVGDFDKRNDDIRFMKSDKNNTEQVNDRFNDELQQQIDGKLPKGHVYQLGKPSSALRSAGIPDLPIELSASKLEMKSSSDYESNHPFELRTVENLPEAIANPIAVFDSKTKFGHKVILTELKSDGNNFVVAMQINSHPKGFQKNIEVNSIRSVYPKDNVKDVINWINRGDLLRYMHKDKILTWVTQQQSNSADVAIPNKDFDIATNIIENFKNPTILDGEISSGIDRMSDELGVEVKKVKDRGELPEGIQRKMKNGRYPGLYDVNTGEVYLVMNEITSVEDTQATMLHEVLGHKGIHGLFGERLPEFCNRVLDSIEEGKREKLLKEYDGSKQLAAEEHVASFAEGYSDPSAWEKVKAIVRNFFRKMGIDLKLSDNDLKYVLWKAKNGIKGDEMVMDVAGKVTRDKDVQGILFRNDANEEVNEENVKVKQVAQEIYEAGTISMMTGRFWNSEFWTKENREGFKNDLGESWHDYMRSLKILQDAVSKEDGKEVKDFENAYLLENHTSSINKVEWDSMMDKLVNPLSETISEIVSKNKINNREMQLDDVEIYLNCVHGLERNEKFAKRDAEATLASRESELAKLLDAKEIDQDEHDKKLQAARENLNKSYLKNRKRDYSGLTGIFDKDGKDNLSNEDLEERAKEYIKQFENIAGKDSCEKLWGEVKAMNDFSLRKSYLCGLLSKRQYEETRGMFDHYVPLRGFDEAVASDVYHYITREDIPLEKTVKKSWGRKSKAGNIIATMMNMGHSAIIMGNKNMVKERFLNFALNHPTSLLSVSEQWYEESADGTDVPVYPVLNDDMTSEQQRDAIEDFDTRMQELEKEGKVKRARGGLKLNLQAEKWQKEEHHVRVREHGREYLVWVNGNPKAAQAVNGLLNVDANENLLLKIPNSLNRFVSKNVTSRNPEFLVSNLARDIQTSAMSSSVKYGKAYSVKFLKNLHNNISFAAVKGVRKGRYNGIYRLYYRYKKGELNMNDPRERLFSEFIENGGETGYSNLWNIDDYEKQIKKIVKRANTKAGRVAAGIEAVGNGIEFANRGIENSCRFSAYMTSRETGKSILQGIADAKEVSVNFNRKGSGKMGNQLAKSLFMFLNPSVQGLMKQLELTRSYPKKMLPMMGGVIGLGFAFSFANALLANLFGGDDDDDDKYNYYKQGEWKRRNNICAWAGSHGFVTIPLSPEIRAFYGLGEIAAGVLTGHDNHENTMVAIASQLSQLIPVDIVDAKGLVSPDESVLKGVLKGLTPTSLSYVANAYGWNEDYNKRKVTNQEDWNKLDPEWKRVPKNTFTLLVESSKWLNERTGGNEHLKSKLDSPVMNPAAVEYLMSSYLGGVATFALKCWKTGQAILGNEDMQDARNYPVVSRLFSGVDNDYSKERRVNNAYKYYESEYEITNKQVKGFEGDMDRGITDHADLINRLYTTGEYRRWSIFDEYKPDMNALNRELKEARKEGNANEAESLMKDIYGLRREMVKRLEEVK